MPAFANPFQGNVERKLTEQELIQAIRLDIAGELEAIYIYGAHVQATDNETARKIIGGIRDEEKAHIGELMTLLRILDPKEAEHFATGEAEVSELLGGVSIEKPLEQNYVGGDSATEAIFYRCEICGNLVALLRDGGGVLTCCGQAMKKLIANTTEAVQEKHVPIKTKAEGKLKVAIGATLHPMLPEHYIEWIVLAAGGRLTIQFLQPGDEPKAEFCEAASGVVYEYCNLHGLWQTAF